MKRSLAHLTALLLLFTSLTGCTAVGEKTADLTVLYGAAAVLSLLLLIGYCCAIRKKNVWFVLMFSAVLVVNVGYFCLAVSSSLSEALLANRIAYLGSVLLPMAMLLIIINVTDTATPRWLPWCLLGLGAVVLFIAGSPGYLDIYYKEVSFGIVNGVATLVRVYGPLHPLYLVYLLGYFSAMIAVIIRAQMKKTIDTTAHAIIIAIAVFVNIGVWFIEQLVSIGFEMLSVSYIISELFLLGVHLVVRENQRLRELVRQKEDAAPADAVTEAVAASEPAALAKDAADLFISGYDTLTLKELELFDAYVSGQSTKDILAAMGIKENTLKYHSRNLYGKLGVTSRKQLVAVYRRICASGITLGNAHGVADNPLRPKP